MGKKKIGLFPTRDVFVAKEEEVVIIGIKDDNAFVYAAKYTNCMIQGVAQGILPFNRFVSEEERAKVEIGSKVTLCTYFNESGNRLLAYHARYEQ